MRPDHGAAPDLEEGGPRPGETEGASPPHREGGVDQPGRRRARLEARRLPVAPTTRFAPAPTGYLHLGHVANAIFVWGIARATSGRVILRIEDHDRQRCRPAFEEALLDDLDWLGLVPDLGTTAELRAGTSPYRQSDSGPVYAAALERLATDGLVYACDCSRTTFTAWAREHGRTWAGSGCPGSCQDRALPETGGNGLRVTLGGGLEAFEDLLLGPMAGEPAAAGDLLARDRHGNWTYPFAVVVDDDRQAIDLVVRGRDLVDDTARQIRLGRLLGREAPPAYLHHPLVLRPDRRKLSKADGDTGIRDVRAEGWTRERVFGAAAAAVGLIERPRQVGVDELASLVMPAPR
jgi:glutamyl/glutaminyl-tRNA synthetase